MLEVTKRSVLFYVVYFSLIALALCCGMLLHPISLAGMIAVFSVAFILLLLIIIVPGRKLQSFYETSPIMQIFIVVWVIVAFQAYGHGGNWYLLIPICVIGFVAEILHGSIKQTKEVE